jgi:large subunit ribosomal protein L9
MASVQVILKEKVANLGAEADVVTVRAGYARNFLVPQGKALEANESNRRHLKVLEIARAEREARELAEAEKTASKIKKLKLKLELSTGQGGKAFGSITTIDIAKALEAQGGITVDRHAIALEKPIKSTGKFEIPVALHPEVSVDIRLTVEAEGAAGEEAAAPSE